MERATAVLHSKRDYEKSKRLKRCKDEGYDLRILSVTRCDFLPRLAFLL